MNAQDASLTADVEEEVDQEKAARKPILATLHLGAIAWGLVYGVRNFVLICAFSAIVVAPIVLFDSDSVFRAAALLDASSWGALVLMGIPPQLGAATFTLVPWGLAVMAWLLLFYAARSLARKYSGNLRSTSISLSVFSMSFSALVVVMALVARSTNVSFGVGYAIGVVLAMTITSTAGGLLSCYGDRIQLPELVRFIVLRAVAATFALFGIGAFIVAVSMIVNFADVMTLFNQLNPGYSGFLGLTVLSIGYLPVLAVWALSYLVGAGVNIGPDVVLSPFIPATAPTQLPPFPPLAILPEQAGAGSWLLPILVVAVGVVWGIGVSLRQAKENPLMRLVIALAIGVIAALLTMALALMSVGDLGDVRLVDLGPSPTLVGSLTWLLLSVGMIPAAMVPAKFFQRTRRRPEMRVVTESVVTEKVVTESVVSE